MPTQYTDKLRLALPETGELSGTWGNTVNNSITQMLEEAITGRAVITGWVADSYTLSEANGTTSEARCVMLDLGGVLTGTGTVLIPDNITKMYIVRNATTGGFAVTVKMSTGTGVSVPNGQTTIVFSDGTNVIEAITKISGIDTNGNLIEFGGDFTTGGVVDIADDFSTVGAFSVELTATGATTVTLPETGTLATLAGTESLINKTITDSDVDFGSIA